MRYSLILLLLSIVIPATAAVPTALPTPAVQPVRQGPLSSQQQQMARQFGQRLANNPSYSHVDADWREFIRRQPRHTNINALLAIVREEAARTNDRNIQTIRSRGAQANQRKAATQRELAHVRQQPASPDKARNLEKRLSQESEMSQQLQLQLQQATDRQTKAMQTLSNILKKMSDTASAIIQNLK